MTTKNRARPVAILAILTAVIAMVAPSARAVDYGRDLGFGGIWNGIWYRGVDDAHNYLGNYGLFQGNEMAYCADPGEASPGSHIHYDRPLPAPDTRGFQAIGYILHKWGQTNDPEQAFAVQAAIHDIVTDGRTDHGLYDLDDPQSRISKRANSATARGLQTRGNHNDASPRAASRNLRDWAISMRREGVNLRGPYSIRMDVPQAGHEVEAGDLIQATVSVYSATNRPVPGVLVRFAYDGDGRPGSNRRTLRTDAHGKAYVEFRANREGPYRVRAHIPDGQLAETAYMSRPTNHAAQKVFVRGRSHGWQRSVEPPVRQTWAPAISTRSSATRTQLELGDTVTDTIYIVGARPNTDHAVRMRFYGPLPEKPELSNDAPAGTPMILDRTVNIRTGAADARGMGFAEATIESPVITEPGWYTWDADYAGQTLGNGGQIKPFDAKFGQMTETGFVTQYAPEATTQTSDVLINGAGEVRDRIMVSGGKPGAAFSGTSTLYGPLDSDPSENPQDTVPAGTPEIGTATFSGTYDGNGAATVDSTPLNVTEPGYYTWVETLSAVENNGQVSSKPFTGKFGAATETSLSYAPQISTEISEQDSSVGSTITDTIAIEGIRSTVGGQPIENQLSGKLYGPVVPAGDVCTAADFQGAPVAAEFPAQSVTTNGSLTGQWEHKVTQGGCYSYEATLVSTVNGDTVTTVHQVGNPTETTLARFRPTATTRTSDHVVNGGDQLSDTVVLTGGEPNAPFSGTSTLYGPFDTEQQVGPIPAGANQVGVANYSGTYGADGTATVQTSELTVPEAGYYVWVEAINATPVTDRFEGRFGVPSETSLVLAPSIATQASHQQIQVGGTISDTVSIAGLRDSVAGKAISHSLVGTVYGPVDAVDGKCESLDWAGAPVAKTFDAVQAVNGETNLWRFTVPEDGCFSYGAVLTSTREGDTTPIVTKHVVGDPAETVMAIYSPVASTRTSAVMVEPGDSLADNISLSGGKPGADFSGESTLFGPLSERPVESASVPADTPVVGTATYSGTFGADGTAQSVTTELTVPEAGYYVWVETIDEVPGVSESFTGPFGVTTETSLAYQPTISTMVSDQAVAVGTTITDTVRIEGAQAKAVDETIVHTVTGQLFGPVDAVDGKCDAVTADDYRAADAVLDVPAFEVKNENGTWVSTSGAVTVEGEDVLVSGIGSYQVEREGCYSYAEQMEYRVSTGTPGTVNHEVGNTTQTTLATEPVVTTEASRQVAGPGETVFDTVWVKGTGGARGELTAVAYGYAMPASNNTCSEFDHDDWARMIADGDVSELHRETITVEGDGTYKTGEVTLEQTGCVTWFEELSLDGTDKVVKTEYGIPEETTLVAAPKFTTVAEVEGFEAGSTVRDRIIITGTHGESGTVEGRLFGPVAAVDGQCEGVDWGGAEAQELPRMRFTGDGEYLTDEFKTGGYGCYSFEQTLRMDDERMPVFHADAGVPEETFFLTTNSSFDGGTDNSGFSGGIESGVAEVQDHPFGAAIGLSTIFAGMVLMVVVRRLN